MCSSDLEQQPQNGDDGSDTTPSLPSAGQRFGQQGDDQPDERREDQAYQKRPAEADTAVAADDAHQHGEETAAQNSEYHCKNTHITCFKVDRIRLNSRAQNRKEKGTKPPGAPKTGGPPQGGAAACRFASGASKNFRP